MIDVILVVEGADMEFVDDKLVPGGKLEVVPFPIKLRVMDR